MDSGICTMLKVDLQDAQEANERFTVFMGDKLGPRCQFSSTRMPRRLEICISNEIHIAV